MSFVRLEPTAHAKTVVNHIGFNRGGGDVVCRTEFLILSEVTRIGSFFRKKVPV